MLGSSPIKPHTEGMIVLNPYAMMIMAKNECECEF
jgi:hypothetical protein